MGLSDNPFISGYTVAELQTLQTAYKQVLLDLAEGGKSYSFPGRTFTRVDISDVTTLMAQIGNALKYLGGTGVQIAQAKIDTQNQFAG